MTVYEEEGLNGLHTKLDILTKRNKENELMDFVLSYEPHAFIVSFEPQRFKGGYLLKSMKKNTKEKEIKST